MAIITVTTLDDTAIAPDGQVSLREALLAANTDASVDGSTAGSGDDTIEFDQSLSGTLTLAQGDLVIATNLTIVGDTDGDGAADITVDGDDLSRVFTVTAGVSTLDALTITGGDPGLGNGGGVQVLSGADLTIANTTVSGNDTVLRGGGIYNAGALTLINTTVSYNGATLGGGVDNNGTATLTNVTLAGNSANLGGGMYNAGTATLTNTTVSGNVASEAGGIYNAPGGQLTLANSIVLGHVVPGNYAEIYSPIGSTLTYAGVNIVGLGGDFDPGGGVMNAPSVEAVFAHVDGIGGGVLADNGGPVPTIALNPDAANPAFDAATRRAWTRRRSASISTATATSSTRSRPTRAASRARPAAGSISARSSSRPARASR